MGKLTGKRERNLWIISSILFLIFAIIASTFYIPVISHLVDVTAPTPLEEGELNPPPDPYLDSIRDVVQDPIIGFIDIDRDS